MRLSVVIPAFNEERRLPATLSAIVAFLAKHATWQPAEIVVVDDGSRDDTTGAATSVAGAPSVTIRCIRCEHNRGKGAAVRTGFLATTGEYILLSDADMATPISEIDALVDPAFSGVAIGSRAVDRRRIEHRQPAYRSLMGRIFNLAVRCLALSGVRDTQCGFKLFPGDLGRALAGVQRIDGFAYDVELLVRARSGGHEIRELPVRWRHIEASRVRAVRHSMEMFLDLLRIWWWRISGQFRTPST